MSLEPANVAVVLVGTTHPGNIGAVARAMNNMGPTDLRLVGACDHLDEAALAFAARSRTVLETAKTFSSLEDALADRRFIVGTTARTRHRQSDVVSLHDIASALPESSCEIAVVFGRENSGLTNEELGLCHLKVHIPTFGEHGSLNLAQAAMATLYELSKQFGEERPESAAPALAASREVEGMKDHLFATLERVGFFNENNRDGMRESFADFVGRARPTEDDVRMLRGFFNRVRVALERRDRD
jgi:TrmH family RNA methyltransferase